MNFFKALKVQRRVILALVLREIKTRFGERRLGFFWVIAEPIIHVGVFMLIWEVVGRMGPRGVDKFLFILTGVLSYFLFRNTTKKVVASLRSNKALLIYPHIHIYDFSFARAVLELMTYSMAFVLLLFAASFFGVDVSIDNILGVLYIYFFIWIFGISFGMFCLPVINTFPVTQYILDIILRVGYFLSGVFFSIDRIPPKYYDVIAYNPMLQLIHTFRANFFERMEVKEMFYDPAYLISITAIMFFIGAIIQVSYKKYLLIDRS